MAPKKSGNKKGPIGIKIKVPVEEPTTPTSGPLNLATIKKPFKNPRYTTPKKNKNLKQLLAMEKTQDLSPDIPTYQNIECPPSIRPQKKYCDITGLEARYTDPKTGLRYHSAEIYQFIRTLSVPNVQAYLSSRNAAVILK
ncbi:YL1 nuclear protein C-terminal domain-domain-containing protein [Syncephalastrum racemosum]|uniref:YL1 nuclear protein C-terminal domain-domain-containing protein n=1 Tax=Syncephalastrum racemosum TaxID=13706 RepID=A0A1X2HCV6_SYNRA|nr:YL1 nuclear protein C-terminal domain-domain-containing protein [Syncephalastrum racemosum]